MQGNAMRSLLRAIGGLIVGIGIIAACYAVLLTALYVL